MRNFNLNEQSNTGQDYGQTYDQDDFARLMSLALDDVLSESETARFERLVYGEESELAQQAEWQLWQHLDVGFAETPALLPSDRFVQRFEQRLAQRERQQRLWFGAVLAVLAVFVWGLVATAVVSFGPAVSQTLGENVALGASDLLQSVGGFFASLWLWVSTVGSVFFTVASTSQVMTIIGLYALAASLAVVAWVLLLRRTTGGFAESTPA